MAPLVLTLDKINFTPRSTASDRAPARINEVTANAVMAGWCRHEPSASCCCGSQAMPRSCARATSFSNDTSVLLGSSTEIAARITAKTFMQQRLGDDVEDCQFFHSRAS